MPDEKQLSSSPSVESLFQDLYKMNEKLNEYSLFIDSVKKGHFIDFTVYKKILDLLVKSCHHSTNTSDCLTRATSEFNKHFIRVSKLYITHLIKEVERKTEKYTTEEIKVSYSEFFDSALDSMNEVAVFLKTNVTHTEENIEKLIAYGEAIKIIHATLNRREFGFKKKRQELSDKKKADKKKYWTRLVITFVVITLIGGIVGTYFKDLIFN